MDEQAIRAFDEARPSDVNICLAVGSRSGEVEATIFEEGAVNSILPGAENNPVWAHLFKEKRRVPMLPLSSVFSMFVPTDQSVDFLNIDAEGADHDILTSNDWRLYRPGVIAVESHEMDIGNPSGDPAFQLLTREGYDLISHVVATSIYRRRGPPS
jgi:FkbM family methyltransferase